MVRVDAIRAMKKFYCIEGDDQQGVEGHSMDGQLARNENNCIYIDYRVTVSSPLR